MSRMLEALRRIENRPPQQRPDEGPAPPEETWDREPRQPDLGPPQAIAEEMLEELEAAVALSACPELPLGGADGGDPLPLLTKAATEDSAAKASLAPIAVEDWLESWAAPDEMETVASQETTLPECLPCDIEPAPVPPPSSGERAQSAAKTWRNPDDLDACAALADKVLGQLLSNRPAVLLFTSAGDGDGKTATVARLAPLLAERTAGEVLVVDANLRSPGLTARFGLAEGQRSAGAWTGSAAWPDLVVPTEMPGLSFLPAWGIGGKSAGGAFDWGKVLREMVQHYRLVLVDAPSMACPEAAQMTCCCEGSYLVVRLGRTSGRALRQAARAIEQGRGRLLGCIVVEP
jgi:Mrp family chromosome partitioning ATPase